jgi:peptidyl-prolyl cis-trans isomerase C
VRVHRLGWLLLLAVAALLLGGCGLQQVQPRPQATQPASVATTSSSTTSGSTVKIVGGRVAVIVNGKPVPTELFRGFLNLQLQQTGHTVPAKQLVPSVMTQLIDNELILQYASAHHITASPAQLKKRLNLLIADLGGRQLAATRLKQLGMRMSDLQYFATISLIGSLVRDRVTPLESRGPVAKVREVLISSGPSLRRKKPLTDAEAHTLALRLLQQVQHGANFAQLAKKYSDDSSASNGGIIPVVYPGTGSIEFDHAVFHGPLHKPVVVRSTVGYILLEVLSRYNAPYPSSVQSAAQAEAFSRWLTAQRAHAKIRQLVTVK